MNFFDAILKTPMVWPITLTLFYIYERNTKTPFLRLRKTPSEDKHNIFWYTIKPRVHDIMSHNNSSDSSTGSGFAEVDGHLAAFSGVDQNFVFQDNDPIRSG